MSLFRLRAFSLLELILVVAVTAVVAMTGVAAYNQHITRLKVEKAALQIQGILIASQNFYNIHSAWPTKSTDIQQYIGPNAFETCPWSPFSPKTQCYTPTLHTGPIPDIFHIDFTAPTTQIAASIAARLPHAVLDSASSTLLHAYVVIPQEQSPYQLVGAQPFMSGQAITVLKCPSALPVISIFFALGGADTWKNEADQQETIGFLYIKAGACQYNTGNPCGWQGTSEGDSRHNCNLHNKDDHTFVNPFVYDPQSSSPPTNITPLGDGTYFLTPYICTAAGTDSDGISEASVSSTKISGIALQMCGPEPNP